mmetsp:Transcript_11820/g.47537  ORF Transcript_11820/g.47537 Transcript_11820/m.47537 type:complete len:227 (-) Transcript_11820:64-744(-)
MTSLACCFEMLPHLLRNDLRRASSSSPSPFASPVPAPISSPGAAETSRANAATGRPGRLPPSRRPGRSRLARSRPRPILRALVAARSLAIGRAPRHQRADLVLVHDVHHAARVLRPVETLRGVTSRVFHDGRDAARVLVHVLGDVVHVPVDDEPEVVLGLVLRHVRRGVGPVLAAVARAHHNLGPVPQLPHLLLDEGDHRYGEDRDEGEDEVEGVVDLGFDDEAHG